MIYVVADVHGNTRRFDSIMKKIDLRPEDTLYVLGDMIDRYPDGIRLLNRVRAMPNAKLLLGNHEHMMLQCLAREFDENDPASMELKEKYFRRWYRNGGGVTHAYLKHISKQKRRELFDYLETLPTEYDVELNGKRYKLVHGAPAEDYMEFGSAKYEDVKQFCVWMRWGADHVPAGDYTLVFGHTPTEYYAPEHTLGIWYGERMIGVDCGCCYPDPPEPDHPYYGRLACLRLDDMKEYYSEEVNTEPIGEES